MAKITKSKPKNLTQSKINLNQAVTLAIENATTLRREVISRLLNPGKNINYECGYPDTIATEDYTGMYARMGIATRVVNLLPDECWSMSPDIYETEKQEEETEFEKAWKVLEQKRFVLQFLQRADRLSGVGRYGIILLGLNDGKEFSEGVEGIDESTGEAGGNVQRELIYLRTFDEESIDIKTWESDIHSPRYGFPKTYQVTFSQSTTSGKESKNNAEVHWTRVIHLADNRTNNDIYGTPRMKPVYNRLLDVRKILSGSGEMFWRGGYPGFAAHLDPEVAPLVMEDNVLKTSIKEDLVEQFQLWSAGLQRILTVAGMKFESLKPQIANPKSHIEEQMKAIAISLGIPYRIFMGTEEAKLASSQDVKTWHRRLANRQNQYLSPMVIRPLINRLIDVGALPKPKEQGYFVTWPKFAALDETDEAEIAQRKTEAIAKYVMSDGSTLISPKHFLSLVLGFTDEEAQAIIDESGQFQADND